MEKGPSAIINAEVGLLLTSLAQASGPYVYFDSGSFSTDGFFSAGSVEGVFRGFVHELVHVYQFRQALMETDLEKAREKFRRQHRQNLWDHLVMRSSLLKSFAEVTEWELTTYKGTGITLGKLKDLRNARTSSYGRTSIIEDMAETVSFVVIGDLTKISKQRIRWAVDLLDYGSLDEVLRHTFPYAKEFEEVKLMGSGITRFDDSKKISYKQRYPVIDITRFVTKRNGERYSNIVTVLEQGFRQRGWEQIQSRDLVLKKQVRKHIFEYKGKWRDLYVEGSFSDLWHLTL